MSDAAVCPECRTRPVPAGRYLCSKCEAALVAATEEAPRRPRREPKTGKSSAKSIFSGVRARMPHFGGASVDGEEEEDIVFVGNERPKWLQGAIMTTLVAIGLTCAWSAKRLADNPAPGATGGGAIVRHAVQGLENSWQKLTDALK